VTLEAAASGLPLVCARAMALPELARPGETGLLYEPGDVAELASHLVTLLGDPEMRARLGRGSRALAQGHGLDATVERYLEIYRALL